MVNGVLYVRLEINSLSLFLSHLSFSASRRNVYATLSLADTFLYFLAHLIIMAYLDFVRSLPSAQVIPFLIYSFLLVYKNAQRELLHMWLFSLTFLSWDRIHFGFFIESNPFRPFSFRSNSNLFFFFLLISNPKHYTDQPTNPTK